jgi:hypothetical protein
MPGLLPAWSQANYPAKERQAPPARDIMTGAIPVKRGAHGDDLPLERSSVRFRTARQPSRNGKFLATSINQSLPNRKQWAKA